MNQFPNSADSVTNFISSIMVNKLKPELNRIEILLLDSYYKLL